MKIGVPIYDTRLKGCKCLFLPLHPADPHQKHQSVFLPRDNQFGDSLVSFQKYFVHRQEHIPSVISSYPPKQVVSYNLHTALYLASSLNIMSESPFHILQLSHSFHGCRWLHLMDIHNSLICLLWYTRSISILSFINNAMVYAIIISVYLWDNEYTCRTNTCKYNCWDICTCNFEGMPSNSHRFYYFPISLALCLFPYYIKLLVSVTLKG